MISPHHVRIVRFSLQALPLQNTLKRPVQLSFTSFESMSIATFIRWPLILMGVFLLAHSAFGQTSRYERSRDWNAANGKHQLIAKLIKVSADSVTLESENGKQASVPIQSLSDEDQKWIADYKSALFARLKKQSRASLFAREALDLFEEFKEAGLVDETNREFIEQKMAILEEEAHVNSIFFGDRFLTLDQLASKKESTKLIVDQWLEKAITTNTGNEQKALREATRLDPTSIEAAILAALHHEIHAANFETSSRLLEDAIKRGQRYLPVSNEHEKYNLVAAFNNLAISSIRQNKISRALKLWEQADELTELQLPESLKYNIAKVDRMINDESSGLKAERAVQAAFERFTAAVGATGDQGGWRVLLPKDINGTVRNQVRFVIVNQRAQELSGNEIEDSRCLRCSGSTKLRCPNSSCREGAIEVPVIGERTLTLPDGSVKSLGRGRIGTEKVRCNTCGGAGLVRCPYCDEGMQRK